MKGFGGRVEKLLQGNEYVQPIANPGEWASNRTLVTDNSTANSILNSVSADYVPPTTYTAADLTV